MGTIARIRRKRGRRTQRQIRKRRWMNENLQIDKAEEKRAKGNEGRDKKRSKKKTEIYMEKAIIRRK